ncbi:MAG TPA: CDP-alcohol phosphatidyltransferase family protein [Candidatus Binatia bacterium]|jgi:phosphatidylglycerophosphate synthase|nr:CDP-alcohol phosphatidyltransferase family protein [Candidatus Binatia bacterium]
MADPSLVRRPIKARESSWAASIASSLAKAGVAPNHISIASVVAGALAGLCFVIAGHSSSVAVRVLAFVGAAAGIQLRLLCNLFDGMVAVEGGRRTKSGEVFNDLPDRIADPFILVGAGYAVSSTSWGVDLGWAAGLLAVLTAYVRVLGGSTGIPQSFMGPMAKQHRMAVMTGAALLSAVETVVLGSDRVLVLALVVVVVGCIVTVVRRTQLVIASLEAR